MLTTAFLSVYMTVKRRAGTEGASSYTSNLVSIVLVVMGAVSALGFVFAAQLVYTQSFTASEDFDFGLTVYFFRFFVIEIVLYALSSIFLGVLNAERDYFWGQAAPIFNNFVTTASFLVYASLADVNPQLALVILALGNPLGVAVQVIMQLPPHASARDSPAFPHRSSRPTPEGNPQNRRPVRGRRGCVVCDHFSSVDLRPLS